MFKVNVIIPIYNAEKYIESTVDSVLRQDYKDWNLLLVDDCSSDKSGDICKRIASADSRVEYIRLPQNGGPSVARNIGIDNSDGEYISFVDADDWVEPNYISRLVAVADEYAADVVWCNYYEECENGTCVRKHNLPQMRLDTIEAMSFFIDGCVGLGSMCNKLYRRSFVEQHKCRLNPKRMHGEDWLFNMDVFRCGASIIPISDVLYHYVRQNANSVISSYRSIDYGNYVRSMNLKADIAREFGIKYDIARTNSDFLYMVINLLHSLVKSDYKGKKKEEFYRIASDEYLRNMLKSGMYSTALLPSRYKVYFFFLKCNLNLFAYYIMLLF